MNSKTRILIGCAAVFLMLGYLIVEADARVRGGGSRGMRTFTPPAATTTAPNAAQPIQRTMQRQPQAPVAGAQSVTRPGGLLGGGLVTGLAAGFLGAGLFGLLAGNGFFGGLAGLASFLGLILQVGLVALIAMMAWRWFQRRNEPAVAGGPSLRDATNPQGVRPGMGASGSGVGRGLGGGVGRGLGLGGLGGGLGGGLASLGGASSHSPAAPSDDIGIVPADYDAFERLLTEIQTAFNNEDIATLHLHATPEMVSYFADDITENREQGVANRVSDVKLLQGDLAEAWREGSTEYASVAMRFSLVDKVVDRESGRLVAGDDRPQEVTEVWTFVRPRGGEWALTAIQEA